MSVFLFELNFTIYTLYLNYVVMGIIIVIYVCLEKKCNHGVYLTVEQIKH